MGMVTIQVNEFSCDNEKCMVKVRVDGPGRTIHSTTKMPICVEKGWGYENINNKVTLLYCPECWNKIKPIESSENIIVKG